MATKRAEMTDHKCSCGNDKFFGSWWAGNMICKFCGLNQLALLTKGNAE